MAQQEISSAFPFTKERTPVLDSSIAYIDTGAPTPTSPTVVFIHGNPTSSYIWRNIIPHVSPIARCIAPDLVGFGDSGKMPSNTYYFRDHVRYLNAFMETILGSADEKIFLVLQDWGSALGFHWAHQHQDKVAGLAFMEFVTAGMKLDDFGEKGKIFRDFRTEGVGQKLIIEENVFIDVLLAKGGTIRGLTDDEMAHYRAPFLDPKMREPIYRFPNEIPFDGTPADVHEIVEAYFAWLQETSVPKLMFWATPGAIISPEKAKQLASQLKNIKAVDIGPANHYVQEENPHLIGKATRDFIEQIWGGN